MSPFLSKKSKVKLKILGWYQIVGGILGAIITLWILTQITQISGVIVIIFLVVFLLYSFSIYSGWLLLRSNYAKGLKMSIINQCVQIFGFASSGYYFLFISGMELFAEIKDEDGFTVGLKYYLGSEWQVSFNLHDKPFFIGINLVAIFFIYFIVKLRNTIVKEKASYEQQELSIGSEDEKIASEE